MYSVLLQPRTKTDKLDGPLIVQVKVTSSPGQVRFPSRKVLVNSWHDTEAAAANKV